MNELMKYLQFSIYTSHYPITFSGDKTNVLNRWLVRKESLTENFEKGVYPCIKPNINPQSPVEEQTRNNWKYYASHHEDSSFYLNNGEELFPEVEDKCIYYLCNVFCKEEKELISYIWHFNTPMRIWINGELVVKNTYTFNNHSNLFIYNFKKGNNIILVERQIYPKYKSIGVFCEGFEFTFKPLDYYKNEEPEDLFDENVIESCYNTYSIVPDRAIYTMEQNISLVILPKYFKTSEVENIRVNIYDYKNTLLKTFNEVTSKECALILDENIKGVIRIEALSLSDNKKISDINIFRGDFIKERNLLIKKAEKRNDCSSELMNIFKRIGKLPSLCSSCGEMHQEYLYNYLFSKYSEFESYLDTNDSNVELDVFDVFKKSAILFKDSDIDDGFIAYGVFLPKNYDPNKKYPLVVTLRRGILLSLYPSQRAYVDKQQFDEAIIVSMIGRGDLNLDYINEAGCIQIIKEVIERFNIDKDSVYFIGECAGATKGYSMALRRPDLIAGMTAMGLPRVPSLDYLNNLNNIAIHNICSVDNHKIPNLASLFMLQDLKKAKNWHVSNLSHLELPEIYNNKKVFANIIEEKKDKYPKLVNFHTIEPYYNKAYWVKIEYISDLTKKSYVSAEVKNNKLIDISTENIGSLSLYLSREFMELDEAIDIIVNNIRYSINIDSYSKVEISIKENTVLLNILKLNVEGFEKYNEDLEINQNLMGIKQTYFKKCIVIEPESLQNNKSNFTADMLYSLQNPLKEFVRNYKYDLISSSKVDSNTLSTSNFVYFNDARSLTDDDKKLFIGDTNITIAIDSIFINENKFEGEYFAVIKYPNPYNKDRVALLVVYNSDKLETELKKFWESYYINPIFHSNAVVYNDGKYFSIREKL